MFHARLTDSRNYLLFTLRMLPLLVVIIQFMPTFTLAKAPVRTVSIDSAGLSFVDGEMTMISCHAGASTPPANITWYIGGKELGSGEITRNADGSTTSVLAYKASWLDQYKQLTCLAYNGHGNRKSHMIMLYVMYSATEVTIENKNNLILVDGIISYLTCEIGHSQPASTITWHLGSKNLGSGIIKRSLSKTNSILPYNASIIDNGKVMKCIANNGITDPKYDNLTLRIATLIPKVSILNKVTLNFSDEQITPITCQVGLSHPPSNITWYLGDDNLGGGNITKSETEILSILQYRATIKDDGKILQCTAENGGEHSISDNITLIIQYVKFDKTQKAVAGWTDTALITGVTAVCTVTIFTICIIAFIIKRRKTQHKK